MAYLPVFSRGLNHQASRRVATDRLVDSQHLYLGHLVPAWRCTRISSSGHSRASRQGISLARKRMSHLLKPPIVRSVDRFRRRFTSAILPRRAVLLMRVVGIVSIGFRSILISQFPFYLLHRHITIIHHIIGGHGFVVSDCGYSPRRRIERIAWFPTCACGSLGTWSRS